MFLGNCPPTLPKPNILALGKVVGLGRGTWAVSQKQAFSVFIYFYLKFISLAQLIQHCMLIKPLAMYKVCYFGNNFKNNLRTLSG